MRNDISLCMIVKNEEKFIEKCLHSVKGLVSEIIIVDTGSRDSTIEIAEKYNAKVFEFNWTNDFSEARNFSLEQATCEYILVLDADEYLDSDSIEIIQEELNSGSDYYINRIKNYSSEGFVRYHEAIRIFKNSVDLKYCGRIHEHLNIQKQEKTYKHKYSKALIHHVGYLKEVVKLKDKINRNLELLLVEAEDNPTGYSYFNLAKQFKQMNRTDEALEYFKKSYYLSKSNVYLSELLYHMADCLKILKRFKDGIEVVNDAILLFPEHTDLHFIKGKLLEECGEFSEAELSYKMCLELGEMRHTTTEGVGSYLAYFSLATIYDRQGKKSEVIENLFHCINIKNDFQAAVIMYIRVLTETNVAMKDIEAFIKNLTPLNNKRNASTILTALYSLRHPLLKKFILDYNWKVEAVVEAAADQYSGEYLNAWEKWSELDEIPQENLKDLIFISIIQKNKSLIANHKLSFNINDKNWELLLALINSENPSKTGELDDWLEEILVNVSESFIILGEESRFQNIFSFLLESNAQSKLTIGELLYYRNEYSNSLPYYDKYLQQNHEIDDVQLVDILCKMSNSLYNIGELQIAEKYIENAYEVNQMDYQVYLIWLRILESLGEIPKLQNIAKKSVFAFPESKYFLSILDSLKIPHPNPKKSNEVKEINRQSIANDVEEEIFFSIIVPTRQRHQYLKSCLETCLDQEYENYEIVVSDNQSSPETKLVVESFSSNKLIYLRTPELLPMSDNWEYALKHASGKYVIFIGDDDGLTLHALKELNNVIQNTKAKVIRWEQAFFGWPDVKVDHLMNRLTFSLVPKISKINSIEMIASVLERKNPYAKLPMLYNSVVHIDVIEELKRKAGRVFGSRSPDVYSGFAIAYLVGEYISLTCPMHIGGASGMSNGIAQIHQTNTNKDKEEYNNLNSNVGLKGNRNVPNLPTIATATYEAFQDAKDHLFAEDTVLSINKKIMIRSMLNEFLYNRISKFPDAQVRQQEWNFAYNEVLSILEGSQEIQQWFLEEFSSICPPVKNYDELTAQADFVGVSKDTLMIYADEIKVYDIYGVAKFIESILGYTRHGINYMADTLNN